MAVTLNKRAFEHARKLIREGRFVADGRDAWSEHQPTASQENELIRERGFATYADWHLGIDIDHGEETKARYEFPFGTSRRSTGAGSSRWRAGLVSTVVTPTSRRPRTSSTR